MKMHRQPFLPGQFVRLRRDYPKHGIHDIWDEVENVTSPPGYRARSLGYVDLHQNVMLVVAATTGEHESSEYALIISNDRRVGYVLARCLEPV